MIYKLGDLVELVTETNSDLKYGLDDIVGVTIEKEMITTIANLTETDLDKFVIVRPYDFIYNPRTHGKKIGLGYNTTNRNYIATWNNNVFRVKKNMQNIILPDYLYMYFLRERWDKEACFHSWGSSTVVFLWESFCNMQINLPSIEEQRKIVNDYKVITDRIVLLEKINANLEEQASVIYKKFFIDDAEENCWNLHFLKEYTPVITGKKDANVSVENGKYQFFSCSVETLWTNEYSFNDDAILIAGNGDFSVKWYSGIFEAYQRTYVLIPKDRGMRDLLYYAIKYALPKATRSARGSVISFITKGILEDISFYMPNDGTELKKFCDIFSNFNRLIDENKKELLNLNKQKSLFLTKLGKGV